MRNGKPLSSWPKNEAMARKYYLHYLAVAKPEEEDEKKAYAYVKKRWGKTGVKREKSNGKSGD